MTETLAADVCIMGAGPVGGTLACRLAQAGVRTVVVDRAALPPMEHPEFDGRAYAIAAGSRGLLAAAGLWEHLPEPPCPILDIRVSDGRLGRPASRLHLHFDHRKAGEAAGPFGWMVEARSLRRALNAAPARIASIVGVCPCRRAGGTHARRRDGADRRRAAGAVPAGGGGGGPAVAAA